MQREPCLRTVRAVCCKRGSRVLQAWKPCVSEHELIGFNRFGTLGFMRMGLEATKGRPPKNLRVCQNRHILIFLSQSPDFLKPGLCYVVKMLYLYDIKINVMQRYHFRPYSPNQTILFPQRIDKDIAEDDPVRITMPTGGEDIIIITLITSMMAKTMRP